MNTELLPCQKAVLLLFELLPANGKGTLGIFLKAFQAQAQTIYKALESDTNLQTELDNLFIKARNELNRIYPDETN